MNRQIPKTNAKSNTEQIRTYTETHTLIPKKRKQDKKLK